MSLLVLFDAAALTQPATGTATFPQSASWSGVAFEKLTATISASQLSVWVATAAEKQPASASFVQSVFVWQAYHKLKIMGYASKQMPPDYAQATGTQPEEI